MPQRAFACPKCQTKLTAPEGAEKFRCPNCKTILAAPSAPQPPAQPQAPVAPAPQPAPQAPPQPEPLPSPGAPPPAPPQPQRVEAHDKLVGEVLGGYRIARRIGSGGMGTVYEAIQEGLKRRVALKVLPESLSSDTAFLNAFKREAQAVAKLNHPNIIQIFDIVADKGFHFFSMEFVAGENLDDRLARDKRLPVVDALQITAQVATALDHANEHMLIHRDIKPSNVLLTQRGDAKLADLGLSKSLEETAVGIVRGTHGGPAYMAPEFARNPQIADCRSDIYSLGAVLYHLVTGQPPFPGPTVADLIKQHAHSPLPAARASVPGLPESVDQLLQKMCAKDTAERFQTYEQLLSQIQLLLKATSVRHPRIPSAAPTGARQHRKSRWLPITIAVVAAAALIAAAVFLVPRLLGSRPSAKGVSTSTDPEEPGSMVVVEPMPTDPVTVASPATAVEPKPETSVPPDEPKVPEPKPPDGPKDPDVPAWEAELAEADKEAKALAGQRKFGEALSRLEGFAVGRDDDAIKQRVAAARQAIQGQATQAVAKARTDAIGLVGQGKLDEAIKLLQGVVSTFGTEPEVTLAQATIQAIHRFRQGSEALAAAAKQAQAEAQAAEARAAEHKRFVEAAAPIEKLVAQWDFAGAAKTLNGLALAAPAVQKQIAQRKAAVAALLSLQGRMIELIKASQPPLDKRALRIPGHNGQIVGATDKALLIKTAVGGEKLPWAELRAKSIQELARRVSKAADSNDLLATGVLLRAVGETEESGKLLGRAEALGAATDALGDPKVAADAALQEAGAANALATALQVALTAQRPQAAAALAAYDEKFGETDFFTRTAKLLQAGKAYRPFQPPPPPKLVAPPKPPGPKPTPTPTPKPPPQKIDPKALALYEKAAAAFSQRLFGNAKMALDELKTQFPKSTLLSDGRRRPSVPGMLKVINAQGDSLVVSTTARLRTLAAAIDALKKPNSTIQLKGGQTYSAGALISGDAAQGLAIRASGDNNARLDGNGKIAIKIFPDTDRVWLEGITFQNAEVGISIYERCNVTLRNCFAAKDMGAAIQIRSESTVDIGGSVLKLSGINAATIQGSVLLCDDASIDYSRLSQCILVGKEITLLESSLTDCLVLGSVRVRDKTALSHVTLTKPLIVHRDIRGARVTNSILPSIVFDGIDVRAWNRKKKDQKQDEALNITVTSSLLMSQRDDFPDIVLKTDKLLKGNPGFANPQRLDFRLADASPARGKASDKTDLGCRFTPDMLKLLKYAR